VLWAAQLCDVQQRRQRRAAALALHRRAGRGVVRQRVEQRHTPVSHIESRWVSKPLAFAGKRRPRRPNN
jgi:hypothetical protein